MKFFFLFSFLCAGLLPKAQINNTMVLTKAPQHQLALEYGVSNIGRAIHLNYGYRFKQNLFYTGLRIHQDANINPLKSENIIAYRYDIDGSALGFNLGYQRYINLQNSALALLCLLNYNTPI